MNSFSAQLREQLRDLTDKLRSYKLECMIEVQSLDKKTQQYEAMKREREERLAALPSQLNFYVGGQKVETLKNTILKRESLLTEMLSSGKWQPDEEGCWFLDRDADTFERVLDYLEGDGKIEATGCLLEELKFLWMHSACIGENVTNAAKQRREGRRPQTMRKRSTSRRLTNGPGITEASRREAEEYIGEMNETEKVKMNVRGRRYVTTKKTLQSGGESSMLSALASGRWTAEMNAGYSINKNSKDFAFVLDYLRTGVERGENMSEPLLYFGIDTEAVSKLQREREGRGRWRDYVSTCTATFSVGTTVHSVAELSNGCIATGSQDKTVKIWTMDGVCTHIFSGHYGDVTAVAELEDGHIASASFDRSVKIWTLGGTCTATFSGHVGRVTALVELDNGCIASGGADGTVKMWTMDGTCIATLTGHKDDVRSVATLIDGYIVSGSADKTVKIWALDGTCITTLSGHTGAVRSVIGLRNGHIASGSADNTVKIWK
ncbi:hypothetical protein PROFUN_11642 [Planoprotostelium fungivorum]|uniref:Potassium channel tetramerisation-type BTB domain-containing protein n=1 Tax=Planoprotostelium fungivorum TaxID=1890364 RepID=A0A2P6N9Q7_9EUKA|nr:hypothetical protein PROFUN_11642 [Planoprotostelium fungivorum]